MGRKQNNMVLIRVGAIVAAKADVFDLAENFDMITYEKNNQYSEISDEGQVLVRIFKKIPEHLCLDLLDWCARHQDVKSNLFKGIQSQRDVIKNSKFGLSKKVLMKISEACDEKEVEYPDCLKEIFELINHS